MKRLITLAGGAALAICATLCLSVYLPIGIENACYGFGHTRGSRCCCSCSGVCDCGAGCSEEATSFGRCHQGQYEKIAFADEELQSVEPESTADEVQAFEDLYSNYNLPWDYVGDTVLSYVFSDTSGLYHTWTLSPSASASDGVGRVVELLSGGISDAFQNIGQKMQFQTEVVSLDFQIGFYRLAYYYFTNYLTQIQTIRNNTGTIITGVNEINDDTGHIDNMLYSYVVPDIADIDTTLTSEQSGTFRYAMLNGFSSVTNHVDSVTSQVRSATGTIGTKLDDIKTLVNNTYNAVVYTRDYTESVKNALTGGNQNAMPYQINQKLITVANALTGANTSYMPYQINQNLANVYTRLSSMQIRDYTSMITQIINKLDDLTFSFDDTDIVLGLQDVVGGISGAGSRLYNAILDMSDAIVDAIDDKAVNVTVPAGSITGIADYSNQLSDIVDLLTLLIDLDGDNFVFGQSDMNDLATQTNIWQAQTQNALARSQSKFPFGVPRLVESLMSPFNNVTPAAPTASVQLPDGVGNWVILQMSLSEWSGIRNVTYFASILLFGLCLVFATKKIVFSGGA